MTSEPKFSPQPWHLSIDEEGFLFAISGGNTSRGKAKAICRMGPPTVDQPLETNNANANLIAAAPDMFEALSSANTILKWFADKRNWREEELSEGIAFSAEWKIGFDPMELARQAKAKSDAALSKAAGETP